MKTKMLLVLTSFLFIMSCSDDDDGDLQPTTSTMTLNINGLDDLGAGYEYEGWVIVAGNAVSTGRFTVNASGVPSATAYEVNTTDLEAATKFVLTIEPSPDSDPAPSDQKYLAGDFADNSATIGTDVAPAIGDFSNSAGTFFLRTPTDEPAGTANNGNDQNGVWFGNPGMPPTAGLELPVLPEGWIYEGWVVGDAGPISTGTFATFDEMDDNADSATSFRGTENTGPPLPGEDFFNNAPTGETFPLDVRGRAVVISIEPVPDNDPAPFTLKPLVSTAGNETAPATHQFNLNLQSFPTGNVSR